jgi:vanillate O-demethylase monooxygenase subunit
MIGPGLVRVELRVAPPGQLGTDAERGYVLCHTDTPISHDRLEWHWILITRSGERFQPDPSMTLAQGIASEFPDVIAQDKWALAKQQEMLEFDDELGSETKYREINLRSDIGVVHARRVLAEMEKAEGNQLFAMGAPGMEMAKYAGE